MSTNKEPVTCIVCGRPVGFKSVRECMHQRGPCHRSCHTVALPLLTRLAAAEARAEKAEAELQMHNQSWKKGKGE